MNEVVSPKIEEVLLLVKDASRIRDEKEYKRQWKKNNPEKVREYNRRWRAANSEKVRERGRERYRRWYANNREKNKRRRGDEKN